MGFSPTSTFLLKQLILGLLSIKISLIKKKFGPGKIGVKRIGFLPVRIKVEVEE